MDYQKLKILRKQAGFTQNTIAKRINVSRDTIANLETGNGRIIIQTLQDYLQAIGLQLTASLKN